LLLGGRPLRKWQKLDTIYGDVCGKSENAQYRNENRYGKWRFIILASHFYLPFLPSSYFLLFLFKELKKFFVQLGV